jgi:chromate reductase
MDDYVKREVRMLAIAGSLRRESLNRRLLEAMAELAPPGVVVDIFDALDTVPLFNEDLESPSAPAAVERLRAAVGASDGLLLATPEYNQSLPGVMKNSIDWLSRGEHPVLEGKPVAILGATAGRWGTRLAQAELRHTLAACEALVMPAPQVYLRSADGLFDGRRLVDRATRDALTLFLAAFHRWLRLYSDEDLREIR